MPLAGTLSDFYVRVSQDPNNGGGTQSYAFTVRKNGADETALQCTILQGTTTCSDTVGTVTFAVGDRIAIKHVPSSSPVVVVMHWTALFTPS